MADIGLLALLIAGLSALAALGCLIGDALDRWLFPEDAARRERTTEPRMAAFGPALRHHTSPDRRA